MVTIRHLEVVPWAIPLRVPLATARGPISYRHGFLVLLRAERGFCGIGEAAPHPAAGPDALATTRRALAAAADWLVGASTTQLGSLLARVHGLALPAASGLDMALHDLVGRVMGRPVTELLGGRQRVAVPISALLDANDPAACACAARAATARGFRHAKLKVGPAIEDAVARFGAAHEAAPTLRLRADANGAWDTSLAVAAARALRAHGLEWLEQPVGAGDVAALARVRQEGTVAVAADESVTGPEAVERLADAGAVDVVVLKLVQVGGLAAARATAATAAARGLGITVTSSIDTTIATVAALHLAAALPGALHPCGLATIGLLAGDLVRETLLNGPSMAPPPGPGLGLTIDPDALARWRTGDDA